MSDIPQTFSKQERLCGEKNTSTLLSRGKYGNEQMLRYCYKDGEGHSRLMISVPKRCLRHAVDRNRVKRQVREAYRNNRGLLTLPEGQHVVMAMIWLDSHHYPSSKVTAKVCNLLRKASESLCAD